jgi:hypothetical protein
LAWLLAHCDHRGDECLIWPFARLGNGYGAVRKNAKVQAASRVMCEESHGAPPLGVHQAAHSCNAGHLGCVNPEHLSWKTPTENAADKIAHGTYHKGQTHPHAKLTDDQVRYVRAMTGKKSQRLLAIELSVSQPLISMVQRNHIWTDVM